MQPADRVGEPSADEDPADGEVPAEAGTGLSDGMRAGDDGDAADTETLTEKAPVVALLGDSTLDNVVWLRDPNDCVTRKLTLELSRGSRQAVVHNLAADGFNSSDVLHGCRQLISRSAREECGDPIPFVSEAGAFEPLCALCCVVPAPDFAVLSIGGNDVREILGCIDKLPERLALFQQNYPEILARVREVTPRVCLMLQYRPCLSTDRQFYGVYAALAQVPLGQASPVQKLNAVMEQAYPPILEVARELHLPVIDLPNTFDIEDDELYEHQIEPSAKASTVITRLIVHVHERHDFQQSLLYRAEEGGLGPIRAAPNDGDWRVQL